MMMIYNYLNLHLNRLYKKDIKWVDERQFKWSNHLNKDQTFIKNAFMLFFTMIQINILISEIDEYMGFYILYVKYNSENSISTLTLWKFISELACLWSILCSSAYDHFQSCVKTEIVAIHLIDLSVLQTSQKVVWKSIEVWTRYGFQRL